ncbi:MAG: hypothetical protein GXO27_01780 [Chlorobi bacterium]|nr:hypothetical protein [Chlorobiota bacterium]
MLNYPARKRFYQKYVVHTKRLAIAFLLLGLAGIIFPPFMGTFLAAFIGWLLLLSGIFTGYYTLQNDKKSITGWLKSLLLIIAGIIMLTRPADVGVSALALVLAVYLLVDAAINFYLAFTLKPAINKFWAVINGIVSTILGVLFIWFSNNPPAAAWLVGLYVGISLLFDAFMLWQLSKGADKIIVEELVAEE